MLSYTMILGGLSLFCICSITVQESEYLQKDSFYEDSFDFRELLKDERYSQLLKDLKSSTYRKNRGRRSSQTNIDDDVEITTLMSLRRKNTKRTNNSEKKNRRSLAIYRILHQHHLLVRLLEKLSQQCLQQNTIITRIISICTTFLNARYSKYAMPYTYV